MVNVPKFPNLDIIFINVSYSYFLSSYFFLIYTYVNLFKIEIHNKFSLTCDLPKYACHYMIINYIFSDKIVGTVRACALLMKNANTLLSMTNLVSVMTSDY